MRATNADGSGEWSAPRQRPDQRGAVPRPTARRAFASAAATLSVAENTAASTDIGAALTATDDDGDPLTYTLEGTDAASFAIVPTSGQVRTGAALDYETKSSYAVTVKAADGNGGSDTIAVTISVTDEDEPPAAPGAPSVSSDSASTTSLSVSWSAPANAGKPAITSYDLQYREGGTGGWSAGPQDRTGTSATISSLEADTSYQVQVRATNADGSGEWSAPGSGRTNAPDNSAPAFASAAATLSVAENTAASTDIGAALTATDDDGDPLTYTLEGTDAASFAIVPTSGQVRTGAALDYETKSSYAVTVKAADGNGGSDTIAVTISVTDEDEPPAAPSAPSVSSDSASTTSLSVSWSAPDNAGKPAISGYEVQYRTGGGAWSGWPHSGPGTAATITGLEADTAYEVRVRATNDEGPGEWSAAGAGRTNVPDNSAPEFASDAVRGREHRASDAATLSVAENTASFAIASTTSAPP